jgi:hypothetical protein
MLGENEVKRSIPPIPPIPPIPGIGGIEKIGHGPNTNKNTTAGNFSDT